LLLIVKINFIEYQVARNPVGFSRSKKPIDEGGRGYRIFYGYNQESLINIGRNDV